MGYIGSSKAIWEMKQNQFPRPPKNFTFPKSNIKQLSVEDISLYWEVQQIDESKPLYLHTEFGVYSRFKKMVGACNSFDNKETIMTKIGYLD